MTAHPNDTFRAAQLALYESSVLKQAKWRALSGAMPRARRGGAQPHFTALDLGSDNGVVSWLLRGTGGQWISADITSDTVDAIHRMVGDNVLRLGQEGALPLGDEVLDLVVVVDLLEHVEDDGLLLAEIARCLRPGGRAIVHVPHAKRWGVLPPLRHALGLTDAWHGHRRSGYTHATLRRLLPPTLRMRGAFTYSRFFSHLLDTALNWSLLRSARGRAASTAKGMVLMGGDENAGVGATGSRIARALYPAMRTFVWLDRLVFWTDGYLLVAEMEKVPGVSA